MVFLVCDLSSRKVHNDEYHQCLDLVSCSEFHFGIEWDKSSVALGVFVLVYLVLIMLL